jgi:hypothetical protein
VRGRTYQSLLTMVAGLWLSFWVAACFYLPALEKMRPVKEICADVLPMIRSGDKVGYYRAAVPSMVYYLRRPIFSVSDPPSMADMLKGPGRVFCVMGDHDYQLFKARYGLDLQLLKRYPQLPTRLGAILGGDAGDEESDALLLISNRAAPVQDRRIH